MTHSHFHDQNGPDVERRRFLKAFTGSSASLAIGSGASLAIPGLGLSGAAQAQTTDYRALVCLFLFGGNDGLNTVVPIDDSVPGAGYSEYLAVRKGDRKSVV